MHVLEVNNLSKSFGKTRVIKNISFNVEEGEIVGFVGPNGAGKTTTLKLITDLIRPDEGEIIINGYPLKKRREAALGSLAGIIENPGLYVNLTGLDNLLFIAKVRGISKEKLQRAIDITGLGKNIHRQVRKYSLGMKQRLALGMCLMTEPKLLILDEPTNGLDPTGTMELRELMLKMVQEEGVSILFSSHMLGEVEKTADRVIYIKDGVLLDKTVPAFDSFFSIILNDPSEAAALLKGVEGILSMKVEGKDKLSVHMREGVISEVLRILTENNIRIHDINKQRDDLELIYSRIFRGVES
ncbi:MAG: ATP-binding cassette domain-containing protein [Clostridiales bacterium]|nr:ATP-binding cassette domain-containing protein [Clostridiales bacterium]